MDYICKNQNMSSETPSLAELKDTIGGNFSFKYIIHHRIIYPGTSVKNGVFIFYV